MNNLRRSAILLLSLEKPVAAAVLQQMPRHLVEKLTFEIANMDDITPEEQEEALDTFYVDANAQSQFSRGGLEFADEVLVQSLGEECADEIMNTVRQSLNSVPFGFLNQVGVDNLLTFIQEEHPQTIALILSHLPPASSAEVLGGLPPDKQLDVIRRVANMEQTNPEVIQAVESSLRSRLTNAFNQQMEKTGGIPTVAQILNVADRTTNRGIIESLEQEDSELAEEIQRLMFVFDDLMKLDDRAIQALLKEVSNEQWAIALKGASEELRSKILGNLSQRAATMLREEMQYLGPTRVSDVETMQSQIVETVRRLEETGEIVISNAGDADSFI